jgi:Domain of unknown function (DUF397)
METVSAPWRTSSYSSGNGGQCVETACVPGVVLVRDTKDNGQGPVLRVSPEAWARFMDGLK